MRRCRMVVSRSTSSSSPPSPTVDSAAPLELDQKPSTRINSLALLSFPSSPSPTRTFRIPLTHSLTHSAFSLLAPPSSCTSAGVSCFALLLPHGAAHADPRREGGGEEPNAHLLPKIVYDRRRLLSVADADGDVETVPPLQKCLS